MMKRKKRESNFILVPIARITRRDIARMTREEYRIAIRNSKFRDHVNSLYDADVCPTCNQNVKKGD